MNEMPKEVHLAFRLLSVHMIAGVVLAAYDPHVYLGAPFLSMLLCLGIWKRSAFAWYCSRYAFAITVTVLPLVFLGVGLGFLEGLEWDLLQGRLGILLISIPWLLALMLLNRPTSHAYFGLACPFCSQHPARAKSLMYRKKGCTWCGCEWESPTTAPLPPHSCWRDSAG